MNDIKQFLFAALIIGLGGTLFSSGCGGGGGGSKSPEATPQETPATDTDGDGTPDDTDSDDDGDGIDDDADNCPTNANNDQTDTDSDGNGDACDDDDDGDGINDDEDAFPADGSESVDTDGDGTGDNTDAFPEDADETSDTDDDGIGDDSDNCVNVSNAGQTDTDSDGSGDACDDDDDGDGVSDADDNCPLDSNAGQEDTPDADGTGDACDADDDGDGVNDTDDAFPLDAAETADNDADGVGNNADDFPDDASETVDTDGDGVGDNSDNCVNDSNSGQADTNSDGSGDACDVDDDGDGVGDADDNCPLDSNAGQEDSPDADGTGDACDNDDNDNGIADTDDPDDDRLTLWVSADEGDDTAEGAGAIETPFATIAAAVTAADSLEPNRNVYVVEGTYTLISSLAVPDGVSLYGGWHLEVGETLAAGDIPTRNISDLTALETIVNSPTGAAAVTFSGGVTDLTTFDGFEVNGVVNDSGLSLGISISNSSPIISNNRITTGIASADSTGIEIIASEGGTASPTVESSRIEAGPGGVAGSSLGISITALSGGAANPTIRQNELVESGGDADNTPALSVGIVGVIVEGSTASITIEDNDQIAGAGATSRSIGIMIREGDGDAANTTTAQISGNFITASTDPSISGPSTVGLIIGQVEAMATVRPINSAEVEENTIIGGSGTSSSIGLEAKVESDDDITIIANNVINGRTGTGGLISVGVELDGVEDRAWIVNNSIDGGNAPESIAIFLDDDETEASVPQIINNIITSSSSGIGTGIDEGCASCDPARLESNLFDSTTLDAYYSDADTLDLTDVADVNTMGDVDVSPVNIDGDPAFIEASDTASADYLRLGATSAAIDTGQDTSSLDTNADGVADIEITADIDGEARPAGDSFDIGADER